MGLGVAECFAAAGMTVRLADATPELAREAGEKLVLRARGHAEAGLLPEEAGGRAEGVEAAGGTEEAVAGVDLVFEAVPESIGLKEEILGVCSAGASPEAVIVSNTSSLPMDDLARFVEEPWRFCGMHWFNPPEWTPGVEVIPAQTTVPETLDRLVGFLRSIGKRPAVVGSGPGFVANRIQNALFLEAVRSCFGFRLPFFGPFAIADMAGLDVYASVLRVLRDGLGERFEPPRMLLDLVEEGRTGTKTGAGFLDYTDEERERLLLERDRRYAALLELLERLPPAGAGRGGG
jgi:3-hydroxybutyryl-CoA dehydrogenase